MRSAADSLPSMRRGSILPPRRKRDVSCDVCWRPARSRSSAARFCWLLLPAADARCFSALVPAFVSRFVPPFVLPFVSPFFRLAIALSGSGGGGYFTPLVALYDSM